MVISVYELAASYLPNAGFLTQMVLVLLLSSCREDSYKHDYDQKLVEWGERRKKTRIFYFLITLLPQLELSFPIPYH